MSNDLNMKVNVLPVLTYNFLHVNDSTLQINDFNISDNKSPLAKELPAGVTVQKAVPFAEAGEIFRKNNDRILAPIDGHVDPNGDTSARDKDQALRTGMGADVDEHGAGIEEEIAQHNAQEETGNKAVEVTMGEGEDERGDNDGHMGIAEPAVENLLHPASEKALSRPSFSAFGSNGCST